MSSVADFYTGGADSVFTQLITANNIKDQMPFNELYYHGPGSIQLLISTDVLNTGTYQFNDDSFGTRRLDSIFPELAGLLPSPYPTRPNIFEFVKSQMEDYYPGHEIMAKERIAPDMITGIVVQNQDTYNGLLGYLRSVGIVQRTGEGVETLFNQPVDRFIRVGTCMTETTVS